MIPRSLGPETDEFVIRPGVVCDYCNPWLGHQVDGPFANRFDIKLTRGLERLRGRRGVPATIEGRDATRRLTLNLAGGTVVVDAFRAEKNEDGVLEIEVRPQHPDPADVVARTIRALWKIALGCAWLKGGDEALDPRLDHLRHAVLGAPFKGYLLQQPFTAMVTRRLHVEMSFRDPADPLAMRFLMGGVEFAVPLAPGVRFEKGEARRAGWEVHTTEAPAPSALHFRLEPD